MLVQDFRAVYELQFLSVFLVQPALESLIHVINIIHDIEFFAPYFQRVLKPLERCFKLRHKPYSVFLRVNNGSFGIVPDKSPGVI